MTCPKKPSLLSIAFALFFMAGGIDNVALGDEPLTPQQLQFFEKHVRPLLSEQWF